MKQDFRHIFACTDAAGSHWLVYRRDWGGSWDNAEPRGGIQEIVEYDLRDAFASGIDLTAYGQHVELKKLDPDVPLRAGAVCYLPEGSPGLPDRWASLNVAQRGCSYVSPFGKRPDGDIIEALGALYVRPLQPWEAPVPRSPFGEPGYPPPCDAEGVPARRLGRHAETLQPAARHRRRCH